MQRILILLSFLIIFSPIEHLNVSFAQINDLEKDEELSESNEDTTWDNILLFPKGNFEIIEGETPETILSYWNAPEDKDTVQLSLDSQTFLTGKQSLRIQAEKNFSISTKTNILPPDTISINGSVASQASLEITITIHLLSDETRVKSYAFKPIQVKNIHTSWTRYILPETKIENGINGWQLQISGEINQPTTIWIDEINLIALVEQKKTLEIFINQIGYDLLCPKSCIIATNFKAEKVRAFITDRDNNELFSLTLSKPMRVISAYHSDWGKWFIRADFTEFNQEGNYKIIAWVDKNKITSYPFQIKKDLLWEKTIPIALEGIHIHRCGMKIENIHDICHIEDSYNGKSLLGGWHDGENYSKTKTALTLNYLAEAYLICKWRLAKTPELDKLFKEELQWGAQYLIYRVNEDGTLIGNVIEEPSSTDANRTRRITQASSNDEDISASALAYLAYLHHPLNPNPYYDTVEKIIQSLFQRNIKTPAMFSACVFLAETKGYDPYLTTLENLFPQDWIPIVEAVVRYDSNTGGTKFFELAQLLEKITKPLIQQGQQNPFGICPLQNSPEPVYFNPEKGNNTHIIQIASLAGKHFRYKADDTVRKLFFDHINWILGVNPFGICFLQGAGKKHLISYSHPYLLADITPEKLKGVIPHGIIAFSKNNDIPYLPTSPNTTADSRSNGISVDTIALFINALAQYYRTRLHPEEVPISSTQSTNTETSQYLPN